MSEQYTPVLRLDAADEASGVARVREMHGVYDVPPYLPAVGCLDDALVNAVVVVLHRHGQWDEYTRPTVHAIHAALPAEYRPYVRRLWTHLKRIRARLALMGITLDRYTPHGQERRIRIQRH